MFHFKVHWGCQRERGHCQRERGHCQRERGHSTLLTDRFRLYTPARYLIEFAAEVEEIHGTVGARGSVCGG